MSDAEHLLTDNMTRFLNFIRARVNDPSAAEDILQDSLLKALQSMPELKDEDKLLPWFVTIIRHTIIDHYRKAAGEKRGTLNIEELTVDSLSPDDINNLCVCIDDLISALKPEYREAIKRLDLEEQDPKTVATDLGISAVNLRVRLHRARQQLRKRLETLCRTCSKHGCLDCQCRKPTEQGKENPIHS